MYALDINMCVLYIIVFIYCFHLADRKCDRSDHNKSNHNENNQK